MQLPGSSVVEYVAAVDQIRQQFGHKLQILVAVVPVKRKSLIDQILKHCYITSGGTGWPIPNLTHDFDFE